MDPKALIESPVTLPDWLGPGLRMISVGLNPSPASVQAQTYFAHPRNRFWPMLNGAGLIPECLVPGPDAVQRLFDVYRIGFTDLVKRPTSGAAGLHADDYRQGALALRTRLSGLDPAVIWFQGRIPWIHYLRYAENESPTALWGLQTQTIEGIPVWVTPNPSPANAKFSLNDLIVHLRALTHWLSRNKLK